MPYFFIVDDEPLIALELRDRLTNLGADVAHVFELVQPEHLPDLRQAIAVRSRRRPAHDL